jgi:hypothetical protein
MSSIVCLSIHHRVNNFKHSFSIPTSDDEVGALKTGFNGLGWVVIGIYRNFDGKLQHSYFMTVSEVFLELIALLRPFQRWFGS